MMLGNQFLMLHFLRFLLKFKALIEILRRGVELENRDERFDVIIEDPTDPMEGCPCYQLYTKYFYELVKSIIEECSLLMYKITIKLLKLL